MTGEHCETCGDREPCDVCGSIHHWETYRVSYEDAANGQAEPCLRCGAGPRDFLCKGRFAAGVHCPTGSRFRHPSAMDEGNEVDPDEAHERFIEAIKEIMGTKR